MTREELEQFIEKHDIRAEHYYNRYQETGAPIDERRQRESEDIADLARTVLGVNEIKEERIGLRLMIAEWAAAARQILNNPQASPTKLLIDIVSYAENRGLIGKEPYECDPDKNQECRKTGCFRNGGECSHTFIPEYRRSEECD